MKIELTPIGFIKTDAAALDCMYCGRLHIIDGTPVLDIKPVTGKDD
jgi:tRNA (Thr-GGU) A37 N-methylase